MNFLDTYGITGTGTSTPPVGDRQPEQSLNEELSQVIGQLGRFWGGFRKQSEAVLASARRDLGQVVTQAQNEIGRLATTETQLDASETEGQAESGEDNADDTPSAETTRPASAEPSGEASTSASSSTIFARLQSTIPPNIVSAVQAQLPDSLRNAQHIDLAQLRSTLSSEFFRVQGVTRAQAEEYVHRSEVLLRDAMKEAGDMFRDAVKVIPPEEDSMDSSLIWDGTDVWMLPGLTAGADGSVAAGSLAKGKGKEVDALPSGRLSEDARRAAVATRAESLLKQLRSNPEIIKLDPAVDTSQEAYLAWADASEASGEGFGTKVWGERIAEALSDPSDGTVLQATFDTLVPPFMAEDVFWVRYFFRVHQIEVEANRRKALLQATAENEDDFSWEDDEDESVPDNTRQTMVASRPMESSQGTLVPPGTSTSDVLSLPSSHAQSPRESSDESYDVVSGNVSSAVEAEEDEEEEEEEEEAEGEEEGEEEEKEEEDSDWE